MHLDWNFLFGGLTWTVLAYAAQTFPMPSNKYAKWLLGCVQFILANKKEGIANFNSANIDQKFDNLKDKIINFSDLPKDNSVKKIEDKNV